MNHKDIPIFRCNATLDKEIEIQRKICNCSMEIKEKINALEGIVGALVTSHAELRVSINQVLKKIENKNNLPVKTITDLAQLDIQIMKDKQTYISIFTNILKSGCLQKKIDCILSTEVISQINYDGVQDKLPFKQYKHVNDALFEVISNINGNGFRMTDYKELICKTFKTVKNRMYKKTKKSTNKSAV